MEIPESAPRERTAAKDGTQKADSKVLMAGKPLHRFVQKEPRSLGIVLLIFGCAELLMGFQLASEIVLTSNKIYIPFWQGALFVVSGSLSIYTELHPSKRMVTVCLAMYVISLLGIAVSVGFRIYYLRHFQYLVYLKRRHWDDVWGSYRVEQLFAIECLLFTSSLCVSGLLIFLCVIARLALKSTRTQVIVQHIPPPRSDTASN